MRIAIPKEKTPGEHRVSMVPALIPALQQLGFTIAMEAGAGSGSHFLDEKYEGVEFFTDTAGLYENADIILKVEPPFKEEILQYKQNAIAIGFFSPYLNLDRVTALRDQMVTSFAMENIPRISRAQSMDALSSQATVVGYKAALMAANYLPRFFPMLTTAAGTIRPATVLVIGAGVAGLQAIATAHRLGAIVKAYDVRTAAREQIESLGAKMINIDLKGDSVGGYARELTHEEKEKQQAALSDAVAQAEAIITTALIPGKPAPKIITQAMVDKMQPGSIIIDTAAIAGGNCELTKMDETVVYKGVTIFGASRLASMVARDASNMYAKNIVNFLQLLVKDKKLALDWEDPILSQSVLTHDGIIQNLEIRSLIEGPPS